MLLLLLLFLIIIIIIIIIIIVITQRGISENGNYTIYKHEEKKQLNYIQYGNMSPMLETVLSKWISMLAGGKSASEGGFGWTMPFFLGDCEVPG